MKSASTPEFSGQTRLKNWDRLKSETFDLLVIGGGITGAGVAWDASSRGLKVALVEKGDFAIGTSSRSSKLIHGGLRYLENQEFHLVFEALSERTFLMNSCPHLVRPLSFYMPIYKGDAHPSWLISMGMWLYDALSLLRAPGLHQKISRGTLLRHIPFLKKQGLECAFRYYDATMWDDAMVLDTLMRAHVRDAAIVSRASAEKAHYDSKGAVHKMDVKDAITGEVATVQFKKLVICAGVWTDQVGQMLADSSPNEKWKNWLAPSRGLHLVFDWKQIPIPGAVVMQHPQDGRISFVIPRKDFGPGVVIVGTTDGPCTLPPDQIEDEHAAIEKDYEYLLHLLEIYFPRIKLTREDVLSHYIGIRPLVAEGNSAGLQKVSREHTIDHGPGGSVIVAGGKYTTYRKMAEEIVDFATQDVETWKDLVPQTTEALFEPSMPVAMQGVRERARARGFSIPESLFDRYGADALEIYEIHQKHCGTATEDPDGFPLLEAQFRYAVRHQMVLSVEDFVRRRQPLYLCRKDHGAPWISLLQK